MDYPTFILIIMAVTFVCGLIYSIVRDHLRKQGKLPPEKPLLERLNRLASALLVLRIIFFPVEILIHLATGKKK